VPKIKTNRSAAKRYRFTKSGKIKRGRAGGRHLMNGKSPQRRRRLRKSGLVSDSEIKPVKRLLPYG